MKKQKPLITRLHAARILLREWRKTVYDSDKSREPGPNYGEVDEATAREIARFDEAHAALTEAIKLTSATDPGSKA